MASPSTLEAFFRSAVRKSGCVVAARYGFSLKGMDGIRELATQAESPRIVGFVLARAKLVRADAELLPQCLSSKIAGEADLAKGFFHGRRAVDDWQWVERLPWQNWATK